MISRYKLHLNNPILVPDHWPIQLFGGILSLIEDEGNVVALQFEYRDQPVNHSPSFSLGHDEIPLIEIRDPRPRLLSLKVRNGISFLQAMFSIDIDFDTVDVEYEPESEEERRQINVFNWKFGLSKHTSNISYDLITRSLLLAENPDLNPDLFFTSMLNSSRFALNEGKYIDSFRYSFLIIDYLFGNGKIKSDHLQEAFLSHSEFKEAVGEAHREFRRAENEKRSTTSDLLENHCDIKQVVEHLIERRGYYFHASKKRKNGWKPFEQKEAQHLAQFCASILMEIGSKIAEPIFSSEVTQKYISRSGESGATFMAKVTFKYRLTGESLSRDGELTLPIIGTTATNDVATQIAKDFLVRFVERTPDAGILDAHCVNSNTGDLIFELKIGDLHSSQKK